MDMDPSERSASSSVRARLALIVVLVICMACASCSPQIDKSGFEERQTQLDSLAQRAVASILQALGASLSDQPDALGYVLECKSGSDNLGYNVAANVTYRSRSNKSAAAVIGHELETLGMDVHVRSEDSVVKAESDYFTVDATPNSPRATGTSVSLSFNMECVKIADGRAGELSQQPDRSIAIAEDSP